MGVSVIKCTAFESKHFSNDHTTLDKQERSENLACKYYENPHSIQYAGWMSCYTTGDNWKSWARKKN